MKFGMIVRADRRGLAYQCRSVYQAMKPDVTVAIDITPIDPTGRWVQDFTVYPDAIITPWRGYTAPISDEAFEALLSCDVVYSAETFYDPRIEQASMRGRLNTVRHVNPELFGHEHATAYWYPTPWRLEHLPAGKVMPLPIPDEHIVDSPPGLGRGLHVGGHRAAGDRNGTKIALDVASRAKHWEWRFTSQDGIGAVPRGLIARSEFVKDVEDRWSLYDGCAVLVMPRRYGGLCLPVLEAAARGLAIVMPDWPPNDVFPGPRVKTSPGPWLKQKMIRTAMMDSGTAAKLLEAWRTEGLDEVQEASLEWARAHAWSKHVDVWRSELQSLLT